MDQQVISGNQDYPEGGFDGLLQAIVCKKVLSMKTCIIPSPPLYALIFMHESDDRLEEHISKTATVLK